MKYALAAWFSLCLATACEAQDTSKDRDAPGKSAFVKTPAKAPGELTDGMEILKRADQALKAVERVSYRCDFRGTGWMASRTPEVEGTVVLAGKGADGPQKYRLDVTVRIGLDDVYKNISVGSDGDVHYLINPLYKTAYVSTDPTVGGYVAKAAMAVAVPHFTHPNALFDELNVDLVTLTGTTTIGGEKCYEIQLQNASEMGETLWAFSKKDFLPRRRQVVLVDQKFNEASLEWVMTELKTNPKFDKDPFRFVLPKGYKKTDEQAP